MIDQRASASTSIAGKPKPISALADATLDEIATLTGVSRNAIRRILAHCDSSARTLSREARELLGCAKHTHRGTSERVYFVQAVGTRRIKIGTTKNLEKRLRELRAGSPIRLRLVAAIPGDRHLERIIHMAFAPLRCGRTEWFMARPILVSYIRGLRRVEGVR